MYIHKAHIATAESAVDWACFFEMPSSWQTLVEFHHRWHCIAGSRNTAK